MATATALVGVNQTLIETGGLATIAAGLCPANVKVRVDHVALTTDYAAASTIDLFGELPAGAKILAIGLQVSAAQSSLTFQLGTDYNADEFAATGSAQLQTASVMAWFSGQEYVVGTVALDNQIQLLTEAATATAGTLYAILLYATD